MANKCRNMLLYTFLVMHSFFVFFFFFVLFFVLFFVFFCFSSFVSLRLTFALGPFKSQSERSLMLRFQGPVAQSVVSLKNSLRVILLTILVDSIYNILIFFFFFFFAETM